MPYIVNFYQSNKEDFTFTITATNGDPADPAFGTAIDFTGAVIRFTIDDENGCQRLTASVGSGITLPVGTAIEVLFSAAQMETLCPGSYKIGMVISRSGLIDQLLTGTIAVYDGVSQI